jgi:Protein of unknown function (DUF507)
MRMLPPKKAHGNLRVQAGREACLPCGFAPVPLNFPFLISSPNSSFAERSGMLINRDLVTHMAVEIVKKLKEGEMVEVRNAAEITQRVRHAMMDEITVEDRINDEAREILIQHQEQMRNSGISYQDMFKKVKAQLARDKKLVLR